ncbi:MAG: formate dehydrogenase subunit gamma [Betaproteobacteria bacterium RIFCSPLOWO2_12_FULL_67_28]|nr:MAG: formate dehydrogenase subunit gamma [Betaproteobacteria bacterium RIFCSPLOWO2_12_FULL_67_28]
MSIRSRVAGPLAIALAVALPGFAAAQAQPAPAVQSSATEQQQRRIDQPGNNAPVWRDVHSGKPNYTSIPGREAGVLIQPQARFPGQDATSTAGEAWRKFRNGPVTVYGGWLVVIVLVVLAAIYFGLGPVRLKEKPTGRLLQRFSAVERWAHWSTAISFCLMAATGLVILFGKHVLLPIIGYTLFAWLTTLSKYLHNFVGPLFFISLLCMIVIYARDNLPAKGDGTWLANGWKILVGIHLPSGRFNAGEKVYFWAGVVVLCLISAVTGFVMLFPNFEQLRTTMQQMNIIHVVAAVPMIAMALGHIYVGTIGIEGSYGNMRDGVTDESWAKEHHELWYNEVKSGKVAAESGAAPQIQH